MEAPEAQAHDARELFVPEILAAARRDVAGGEPGEEGLRAGSGEGRAVAESGGIGGGGEPVDGRQRSAVREVEDVGQILRDREVILDGEIERRRAQIGQGSTAHHRDTGYHAVRRGLMNEL